MSNKNKTYEVITNSIIELLEKGCVPWRQPWVNGPTVRSYHGHSYRGINALLLSAVAKSKGYRGAWITFKQTKKLGGSIRKGEKGTPVVLWKWFAETDDDGEPTGKTIPFCRYYRVFSICQTEGIEDPKWLDKENQNLSVLETIESAEKIWEEFVGKPELQHGGERACYRPSLDRIEMPELKQFCSAEHYFLTLFHEATHSTGSEKRLGRFDSLSGVSAFGSESYSREELVAETGAAFLASEAGISSQNLIEDSASYIQSWIRVLKAEPKMVVIASAQAQKASDHILGRKFEERKEGV